MLTGSSDRKQPSHVREEPVTTQPAPSQRRSEDVIAHSTVQQVGTDAVVSASTTSITGSLTTAEEGDLVRFTSGNLQYQTYVVQEVSGAELTLAQDIPEAPAVSDTFVILRFQLPHVDPYGHLEVANFDFVYEAAMGRRTGYEVWNKFGYNDDVDTAAAETVWSNGGLITQMTSADTLDVVSTDLTDDAGNTGATAVVIFGVDENWAQQIEVVTLDGTNPVTTLNQWLGVNRVSIFSAGADRQNNGTITAQATTAATIQAHMPAGEGTTQQLVFFVPASNTYLLKNIYLNVNKLSGGGTPRVTVKGWVSSDVSNARYEVFRHTIDTTVENVIQRQFMVPFVIAEKAMFSFEATTTVNNTIVAGRFSGILAAN